jgi:hypothetical protein
MSGNASVGGSVASVVLLGLIVSTMCSRFDLCGGYVEQPLWEPYDGGALWEQHNGQTFTSLVAKVPTNDHCDDGAGTTVQGTKVWGGSDRVFFATVISDSW